MKITGFTPFRDSANIVIPNSEGLSVRYYSFINRKYVQSLTGFTLLEVLAVIVIVGILVGLLIPTMGSIREQGRRIQCLNNLRQHGIAWYLYLADHNNCFPKYGTDYSKGETTSSYFGGKEGYSGNRGPAASIRVLNPYLEIKDKSNPNVNLFHCPDDSKNFPGLSKNAFDTWGNSYNANTSVLAYSPSGNNLGPFEPRPIDTVTFPKNKVYLEDDTVFMKPGHGPASGRSDNVPVMVLFVDGHVKGPFMSFSDFNFLNASYDDPNKPVLLYPNSIYPR